MKKGVLIILLTVTCGIAKAQRNQQIAWPVDPVTGRITFTASVYVTDAPANQLLHTAEQYVAKNFNTTLDSIIYIDERSRKIAAQGGFLTNVEFLGENGKGRIQYTFTISCINNLYKYTFTNFEHVALKSSGATGGALENDLAYSGGTSFPRFYWDQVKESCYYTMQNKIEQLQEFFEKHAHDQGVNLN